MLISSASFAAVAVTAIGLLVFWSNPRRTINRLFLSFSIHLMAWLVCVHQGVLKGEDPYWVRLASTIGAFAPAHMWLLKEACIGIRGASRALHVLGWMALGVGLTAIVYSRWYVDLAATGATHLGPGYFAYMVVYVIAFSLLARETLIQIKTHTGLARLELQFLLIGGTAMCMGIVFLMALRAVVGAFWPIRLQPFVALLFYAITVVAITTHRVFSARQLLLAGLQRGALVIVALAAAFVTKRVLSHVELPEVGAWFGAAAIALWCATLLNRWFGRVLHFYPEGVAARQAAFTAARETRAENLEKSFTQVLRGWGQCDLAVVLYGTKDSLSGGGIQLSGEDPIVATMRRLRWATPERLTRERMTQEREALAAFLAHYSLGALVLSEGSVVSVMAGVGVGAGRFPFTYPQVSQLLELASIMESAFERAHLSVKVQHAEQLATVGLLGASLAHEIRNPLVSIKTFVQLLPQHHNDPKFREKFFRLITDEVDRIDQLTEQLLDLASPRTYTAATVALHPVLRSSLDLVTAKAAHKQVQFVADFNAAPDTVFTDPSAAKQVMLNLCFNAIQAVEEVREGPRCVWIATRNVATGVEMAVSDSGPGVAPEIMPRLFQPFQTTKSSGFGLGLAICSDILANLNASITVDPPAPGRGATFRVTFPCQPSSS